MDDPRFDALTRSLAANYARRGLTRLLGGLILAGPSALLAPAAAAARKKGKKEKKKRKKPNEPPKVWTPSTTFGKFGAGPDDFRRPSGIDVSADGTLAWIAETGSSRVSLWRRSSPAGADWSNWTTFGSDGSTTSQFRVVKGIFASADGLAVWVADAGNHRVSVWTRPSAASAAWANQTTFGSLGSGASQFNLPADVHVSADGLTAWVVDELNNRVSVWTRSGPTSTDWTNQTTFGSVGPTAYHLLSPLGVDVSSDGLTAYVADTGKHRILVWRRSSGASTDWAFQTSFSNEGSGSGQLKYPIDVAVAANGLTAWVTDSNNDRVSIWTRPNLASAAWTNAGAFGSGGSGANQFKYPWGIVAAQGGKELLIAENDNHRVSVWTLS